MSLVLRGYGHPAIRATHSKTLELTPLPGLGAGGTCIVGVGVVAEGLPPAGWVRVELRAGTQHVEFEGRANPEWDVTGPAVIRRSAVRRPDTLATHATAGASDLPPELVAALTDPAAVVTLLMEPVVPQPPALVIWAQGAPSVAELGAAGGGRQLVVGSAQPDVLIAAPQPVEIYGLAPAQAVAAASPLGAGAVLAEVRALADPSRRGEALVLRVAVAELGHLLRSAERHGRRSGALLGRLPWVRWGPLDELVPPAGVRTVWLCLDPVAAGDLDARIAELRAARVGTKELARVLAAEFGLPVKDVYARALERS